MSQTGKGQRWPDRLKGMGLLLAVCMLMGIIWGKLLPTIGQWSVVRQWIEPLKAEGIHPDGLYYTDVFSDNRHNDLR